MRLFTALCFAVSALAQTSLIGINSSSAVVRPGARDVVTAITVDPSPDGGDLLAVMLMADGIQVQIEMPDGRRITQSTAASMKFEWEVTGQGQEMALLMPGLQGKVNHLLILPPNAPNGRYRIHADASNLKENSALMVIFMPIGSGAKGLAGDTDTVRTALTTTGGLRHYAGDKVELIGAVFEGDRSISNARLTGQAVEVDEQGMPKGKAAPVNFKWIGTATSGAYHAELPMTAAGEYSVAVKVRGKYANGTEFERNAGDSITIEPRRAQILSLTERPLDDDGNGLIDRIEITARLHVDMPGEYFLLVDLTSADGKHFAPERGKAELGLGEGTITAWVDRYSLTHVEADGPYKMDARIFRKEGAGQGFAFRLEDAGVTRAYKRSTFDRGPYYFAGTATATPKSATGKAPFDQLVVGLDVFTPGGDCNWMAHLRSGNKETDLQNNVGKLPKGASVVTLTFLGDTLASHFDGSPLEIRDATIMCGKQTSLQKPIALPLFPAGTFAKLDPAFELVSNFSREIRLTRGNASTLYLEMRVRGTFDEAIAVIIEGLPEGVVVKDMASHRDPISNGLDTRHYQLQADANLPAGSYPLLVRAKSRGIEHTLAYTLVVP
jgi:hypothetical protein